MKKNNYCQKCGTKVEMDYQFCVKCGNPIEVKNFKHKKLLILFFSILLGFLIIAGAIFGYNKIMQKQGYFLNTRWGMTMEELMNKRKNVEKNELSNSLIENIENANGIKGNNIFVSYSFEDNKLKSIFISNFDKTKIDDVSQKYIEYFNNLYTLSLEMEDTYFWDSSQSEIGLMKLDSGLMISYSEVKNEEN